MVLLVAILSISAAETSCSRDVESPYSITVAAGYQVGLVATGLARPRGIHFDKAGHLLVVEAPKSGSPAITALSLEDNSGSCVGETSRKVVVQDQGVSRHPLGRLQPCRSHLKS
jgi:glucose/arabinose dehydrogenase